MRGWCGYTATYLGPVRPGHQRKTCPCDQPQHACQHRNEVEADHGRSDLLLGGFRGRCLGLHDLERGFLCRAELQACSLGVVRLSQKVTAENGIASLHAARWLADLCQRHGARKIRRHVPNTSHGGLWLAARLWSVLLLRSPPPRWPKGRLVVGARRRHTPRHFATLRRTTCIK